MKRLPAKSIDLIYWDPPFATTRNFWDEKLDWPKLFSEAFRLLKDTGMLVMHCSIPFNYELIRAAPKPPNYSWYWKKPVPTCPLIANQQPLRVVEEVLVWRNKKNTYYRQNIGTEKRTVKFMTPTEYYGKTEKQGTTVITGKTRTHLLEMPRCKNATGGRFTRDRDYVTRSDEMMELFIKHYTKEGDVVLDPTCFKGATGVVCKHLKRRWIGIDKYFFPELLMTSR